MSIKPNKFESYFYGIIGFVIFSGIVIFALRKDMFSFFYSLGVAILFIIHLYLYKKKKSQKYTKYIFIFLATLTVPFIIPPAVVQREISLVVLTPPILALGWGSTASGFFSATTIYSIMLIRGGLQSRYGVPINILMYFYIIALIGIFKSSLQASKKELEAKYQFEKEIAGILGHELKTPLTQAKANVELLKKKLSEGKADLKYIKEKVEKVNLLLIREAETIQSLLSSNHVDNSRFNLHISKVNLKEVIEYTMALYTEEAAAKGIDLIYETENEIPTITTDFIRVQEIVNNIVSNAIKYTTDGSIKIHLEKQNADYISIKITDTGVGIPKDQITKLGKKFYRAHESLKDKDGRPVKTRGTGLGLYVVKGFISALHGKLDIISTLGKGSTFSVRLPINHNWEEESVMILE
jgi:signal transduction histidine kinase